MVQGKSGQTFSLNDDIYGKILREKSQCHDSICVLWEMKPQVQAKYLKVSRHDGNDMLQTGRTSEFRIFAIL